MTTPIKSRADFYAPGDWNVVCYVCGWKYKASMMVKHWQGYYVCPKDWEARQPQDFVRGVADTQIPPWTQPFPGLIFTPVCGAEDTTAIPYFATPGCVLPGYISPNFVPYIT